MSDLVVRDVDALYVGLQSTVKREAERIANHVLETARKDLARRLQRSGASLTYSVTAFPEDAAQEADYFKKVFSSEES